MVDRQTLSAVSAVILAGGNSSRMKSGDKALLRCGGETLLHHLSRELSGCGEVLLSVDRPGKYPDAGLPEIVDTGERCGPLGGICTALRQCRYPLLLTVACDMPLFQKELAVKLLQTYASGVDAVAAQDDAGFSHPLCALYAKSALPVLEARRAAGNYRMRDALAALKTVYFPVGREKVKMLKNVNEPEEWNEFLRDGFPTRK